MGDKRDPFPSNPVPTLEEKVDMLTTQLSQLVNLVTLQAQFQNPVLTQPSMAEEEEEMCGVFVTTRGGWTP